MTETSSIENTIRRRRILALFTPSWLSMLCGLVVAIGVAAWVIAAFTLKHSGYNSNLLLHPHGMAPQPVLTLPGQNPPNDGGNSLQNTWPLIAFWAVVGLIVYFIVDLIMNAANHWVEFERELNYVHAKRNIIFRATFQLLIIRVILTILWLYFLDIFFKRLIPDSITLAHQSVHAINLEHALLDVVYSCLIMLGAMHLNAIFLRLIFRRTRIWTKADYVDV